MRSRNTEIYEFGQFRLDVGEHRLEHIDSQVRASLPEKAFQTLVHLIRNSGRLLTKDELLSAIWPDTIVEENNLGKAIYAVRHFLDGQNSEQDYIETVPKHGYRFVAEVRRVKDEGHTNVSANGLETPIKLRGPAPRSGAYDLYVRGKVKAGSENRQDTEDAIKALESAVAIDPFFAEAYAQLARAYNTLSFKFSSDAERKVLHENAEVAIEKALALNPNLAEAHFARGLLLWTNTKRFPHEQAIKSYRRSLELNANSDETYHQLSLVYAHTGLLDEAQQSVRKALDINPNNTMARFRVGVYTAWQGRFEQALAILKTIPSEVSPMLIDRIKSEAFVQIGRLDDAKILVDDFLDRNPDDEGGSFTSVRALLLAKAGKREEVEPTIAKAVEIGSGFGHFHHTAFNIASAYAIMNKADNAIKWLQTTADDGFPCYSYFAIDPNLENLRPNPRFIEFIERGTGQMNALRERILLPNRKSH